MLLGPWERVESATRDVLARAGGRPGHIFNLGHGVLPGTDPDALSRLAALVQEFHGRGSRLIPDLPAGELEAVFGTAAPPEEVLNLRGKRFASTMGVWRVISGDRPRVLKHLALGAGGTRTWPSDAEMDSPHYWRREVEVYEHGLPPGAVPAAGEHGFERGDG